MAGSRFVRYELRTTDVHAARAFYAEVVSPGLWEAETSLVPLPDRAAALGAPAHWLGELGVPDVEGTATRIVERGGQPLGPTQRGADGACRAVLRDPFGAVVALSRETSEPIPSRRGAVAWRLLDTQDHELAFALYASLFRWTANDVLDLGPAAGSHQMFSWDDSGRSVGSVSNAVRTRHVHPQWLFFFRVADLDDGLARVRALGGKVFESTQTSTGDRLVACDDPQGAGFGLYQFAERSP